MYLEDRDKKNMNQKPLTPPSPIGMSIQEKIDCIVQAESESNISENCATLVLADGTAWQIIGGDKEASTIVSSLGEVLQLESSRTASCKRLIAVTNNDVEVPSASGIKVFIPASIQSKPDMYKLLLEPIYMDIQDHLGLLIHGALAEYHGMGIILAGPGGAGKTTTSNRLPRPWQSLSDDLTIVVRDSVGTYWAHPWPTWSRFLRGMNGGSWNVSKAVPLIGVFFLIKSDVDNVSAIGAGEAVCDLINITEQAIWWRYTETGNLERTDQRIKRFEAICIMVKTVPCFILRLSLDGHFWDKIISTLKPTIMDASREKTLIKMHD